MSPAVREILEFCIRHAEGAKAQRTAKETDMERAIRLAEETAYRNVANFIENIPQ